MLLKSQYQLPIYYKRIIFHKKSSEIITSELFLIIYSLVIITSN